MIEICSAALSPAFGVVVGAVVTWFAAYWYYKKAGDELRSETAGLRRLNDMILRYLSHQGAEVIRDSAGDPIALKIPITASLQGTVKMEATLGRKEQPKD